MEVITGSKISKGMFPLLALHTFIAYDRTEGKSPVTAALIATNTLIYLRPPLLNSLIPSIDQVWFNPHLILENNDLKRFFLSVFYHTGEPHLVYNMTSLLWKGIHLETKMGSVEFASMVASLLALSQGITLMLSKTLRLFYYNECPIGFSGVLFAMEVVLNSQSTSHYTYLHGVIVNSRDAAWAELLLLQMFAPGVSFFGHLGGILAGLLYMRLRRCYSGSDPLTFLIRGVNAAFNWTLMFSRVLFRFWRRGINAAVNWTLKFSRDLFRYCRGMISGRGTRGGNQTGRTTAQSAFWRCQACTYDNHGLLSVCEICGTRRDGDILSSFQLNGGSHLLSLDGLGRQRIDILGSPEVKELQSKKRKIFIKPPEPPKEPVFFKCPICMGPFVEEMSTRCGHIFCKNCIKAAIRVRVRGKCPTCRKNITVEDLIRVFLPSTS